MSKIKPLAIIESMSGKVCEHSDMYFRTRKKDGKVFTGKLCNPSAAEPSAIQLANQVKFKAVHAQVKAIMSDHSSTAYQSYKAAFDSQTKHPTLMGLIFADKWASYQAPVGE